MEEVENKMNVDALMLWHAKTVPPTCKIVYQCKGHAISVFLKVHQWNSRSI